MIREVCNWHEGEKEALCMWCGAIICWQCMDEAQEKKVCRNCISKLPRETFERINPQISSRHTKNVDVTLSDEEVSARRERVSAQFEPPKEKKPGVTNTSRVNNEEREEIQKWLDRQRKLREKFLK